MKLSVFAAAAIDQMNKSVMDRWLNYTDQFCKYPRKRK